VHRYPGENLETTHETIALLTDLEKQIDRVSVFRFVPLPGTDAYNRAGQLESVLPTRTSIGMVIESGITSITTIDIGGATSLISQSYAAHMMSYVLSLPKGGQSERRSKLQHELPSQAFGP